MICSSGYFNYRLRASLASPSFLAPPSSILTEERGEGLRKMILLSYRSKHFQAMDIQYYFSFLMF